MFGLGKILGSVAGGLLDKIGLGKIAPFVKMGLNAMTGNWLGVAQDVFGLVSGFKGNPLNGAANRPPLGGFDNPLNFLNSGNNPLGGGRMSGLLDGIGGLIKGLFGGGGQSEGDGGNSPLGGLGKIFDAFKIFSDAFSNNDLFSNRASTSQFNNLQA
jgi:hypothetical protein